MTPRRLENQMNRRRAIIAVARRSFLESGYAGTTMSAISAEVGGSKSTLWSYFQSKEDLFEAVLEQSTSIFRNDLEHALSGADTPAAIEAFCIRFIGKITSEDGQSLYRLVTSEGPRFPEIVQSFTANAMAPVLTLLSSYLQKDADLLAARGDTPDQAADILIGLCVSRLHNRMISPAWPYRRGSAEDEAQYIASIFCRTYFGSDLEHHRSKSKV